MKVIIDTEEKTFKIVGWVTIPELTEFVDKHGFGEYIMKFNDPEIVRDPPYTQGCVNEWPLPKLDLKP